VTAPPSNGTIHHLHADEFDRLVPRALANVELRGALARATDTIRNRRSIALEGMDLQALRARAKATKSAGLARLDEHLERFEREATARGAIVHWARDAAEARRIVVELAAARDVRLAVKSKSMVSEEIGLNDALLDAGIVPVETDLGEWIVQLAEETPSHILAPAIHKRRVEIRDLLARVLGRPMPDDAEGLTAIARAELRPRFASAELGISGGNFLVAETGSFLLIENEGNIRLTTSLPRTHIAVIGIEKVVPTLGELGPLVRLITRSATGQAISCYQTLVTGPKRTPEDDGPDDLHIVLVDNGRAALLANEITAQTLRCIRCSACLNVCPVYRQIGGHAYGSVYPGPIGAIFTPQIAGMHAASQLPGASSLCGACREVCPVDIDIPGVLLHLRGAAGAHPESADGTSRRKIAEKSRAFAIWRRAATSPTLFRWFGRGARLASAAARLRPSLGRRLGPLAGWLDGRTAPRAAAKSFSEGATARRIAVHLEVATMRSPSSSPPHASDPADTSDATTMSRDVVLGRIRVALTRAAESTRHHVQPPPPAIAVSETAVDGPMTPTDVPDRHDLIDRFASALERVQGVCHRVTSEDGAVEALRAIMRDRGVRCVVRSDDPLVRTLLEGVVGGFELLDPDADRARLLDAGLGVTRAAIGVAEYGTIVLPSGASPATERTRFAALLPEAHVAIVAASDLVSTWDEALAAMRDLPDGPPPTVTFATGPSRTADIELELVLGVHGPRAQHVIVLEHR
jgi:L-lactate dehydrogenase complex protein LldF